VLEPDTDDPRRIAGFGDVDRPEAFDASAIPATPALLWFAEHVAASRAVQDRRWWPHELAQHATPPRWPIDRGGEGQPVYLLVVFHVERSAS
jgi:hypothetical protein